MNNLSLVSQLSYEILVAGRITVFILHAQIVIFLAVCDAQTPNRYLRCDNYSSVCLSVQYWRK